MTAPASRACRLADRIARWLLLAIILITPWPLGARLPWAAMLAATAVVVVATAWIVARLLLNEPVSIGPLFLPMAAFLGWTGMQWAFDWTIYSHATAYEWVRYLSYALVCVLTVNLATSADHARRLYRAIIASGLAVGVFGLVQFLPWNGRMFWFYTPVYFGTPFGPFNNRNYFAGFMAVALPAAVTYVLAPSRRRDNRLATALTGVAVLALLVSLSRGGFVALVAAVIATMMFLRLGDRASRPALLSWAGAAPARKAAALAMIVILLLGGLVWLGQIERVLSRLETLAQLNTEAAGRLTIWRGSLPMLAEHPIVGFGLNTYMWAFPRFRLAQTPDFDSNAHNEYLEMAIETGAVGAILCVWFLWALFSTANRRLRCCESNSERRIVSGALGGWVGLCVFALTDFPTIIPAINYVAAVLAGLAVTEFGHAQLRRPKTVRP